MIKIDNTVTPSGEQWEAVVRGVRNPFNSWDRSDSRWDRSWEWVDNDHQVVKVNDRFNIGKADMTLMTKLANAGDDHGKFLRMLPVICDIEAPTFWLLQLDTYKLGTVSDSCSKMHTITNRDFELSDFCFEDMDDESLPSLADTIKDLNVCRSMYNVTKNQKYWNSIMLMLPQSYMQRRTWSANYQTLRHIYNGRKNHKLYGWHQFCDWIKTLPYAQELICGDE